MVGFNVESNSHSDPASAVSEVCGFAFTSLLLRDPEGVRLIDNHWRDVTAVIQRSAELQQTHPRYEKGEVQAGQSATTSLGHSLTALD